MIANYISEYINDKLNDIARTSDADCRVILSGLPKSLLENLYKTLCLKTWVLKSGQKVGVYFLDDDFSDPPNAELHAECTASYFVGIRNNKNYPVCIALTAGKSVTSIDTTVREIGVSNNTNNFNDWFSSDLIQHVLKAHLSSLRLLSGFEIINDAIKPRMKAVWNEEVHSIDRFMIWESLERVLDSESLNLPTDVLKSCTSNLAAVRLSAALGLPFSSGISGANFNELVKLRVQIKKFFKECTFEEVEAQLSAEISDSKNINLSDAENAVREYFNKLEDLEILDSNQYYDSSFKDFKPTNLLDKNEVEDWWGILNEEIWNNIVANDQEGELKFTNTLFNANSNIGYFQSSPNFKYTITSPKTTKVELYRSVDGKRTRELVKEINVAADSSNISFDDLDPPDHKNKISYWVQECIIGNKPIKTSSKGSVVVLDKLNSKIVFLYDDKGKESAKVFKAKKDSCNFSCDLELKSQGEYDIKIYSANTADMPHMATGKEVDSDQSDITVGLNEINPNYHTAKISIDESCSYEWKLNSSSSVYSINLKSNESPDNYSSEFHKLLCQHFGNSKGHVQPKDNFLNQLEACYLKNDLNSWRPIHMSYEFINNCIEAGEVQCEDLEEKWKNSPSKLPTYWEQISDKFDIYKSKDFVNARQSLLSEILSLHEKSNPHSEKSFKSIRFSEYFDKIQNLTKKYLEAYLKFLENEPDIAKLCDVIGIGEEKGDQGCPDIVLLSPAHPIRLSWHILTHEQLQTCLDKSHKCPGVGFINSSSIPKSFNLSFWDKYKKTSIPKKYYSAESCNDYWSVFMPIGRNDSVEKFFSKKFGAVVSGLAPGLSRRHVLSAMEDVGKVISPATDLDILITKSEVKSNAVFEGVEDWCNKNLVEEDGPSTFTGNVNVLDNRTNGPDNASISYLSEFSNSKVEWYYPDSGNKHDPKYDLTLTPDLGGKKRDEGLSESLNSHIDKNCLVRWDLRYETQQSRTEKGNEKGSLNLNTLQETQIIDYKSLPHASSRSFEIELLKCVNLFEMNSEGTPEELRTNTIVFPSDPEGIKSSIDISSYLAISSANVDPAMFFDLNEVYIWNLDLPQFSEVGRNSDGYYLLAKAKNVVVDHFSTAYEKICGESVTDESVKSYIKDLSVRGIPTIKAISHGGRTAFGEVGLHACLKALQSIEEAKPGQKSIFPLTNDDGDLVNLIIPIDLFGKWLGQFRKSLGIDNENRPDLLCISIKFNSASDNGSKPIAKRCKITPVEVKTRDGSFTKKERLSALKQADSLCNYLIKFKENADTNPIWNSSFKGFIESFLSYGFRTATNWSCADLLDLENKYDATIAALANDSLEIEISEEGKAFIISHLGGGAPEADNRYINVEKSHVKKLLIDDDMNFQNDLYNHVRDWGLFPKVASSGRGMVPSAPISPGTGTAGGPVGSSVNSPRDLFENFFKANNVQFTDLYVTQTGLDKSIFDATESIRDLFAKYGFHDYANQSKGQAAKLLKPILFFYNGEFIDLEMSLYRPETKKGDPRFWIKDGKKYIKADSNYVLFFNGSQLHVVNSLSYSDFVSSGHISLFNKPSSVELDQSEISEFKFPVGHFVDGDKDEEAMFCPGNTDLNQLNVGIVGDLGTGKTQLIKSLIYRMVSHPELNRGRIPNLLIFDYKNDYTNHDFVSRTNAKVVDPSDLPLNLFDLRDSDSDQAHQNRLQKVGFFRDALDKIYSNIGPKQRELIKIAVMEAYDQAEVAGRQFPLLSDVLRAYKIASNDKTDSVTSVLSDLVDHQLFTDDQQQIVPFKDFLNGVVVINLKPIGQDDSLKAMLVTIFLNLFYDHMQKIEKQDFIGNNPSLRFVDSILLVDEADNIMKHEFAVLRNILKEGREYGVGVWLASQYLSHFKTKNENYCEPLLTWFIHKVPNLKAKDLSLVGLSNSTQEKANRVTTLEVFGCLYKSLNVPGHFIRGIPFFEILDSD